MEMETDGEDWPTSWACAEKIAAFALPIGLASQSAPVQQEGQSLPTFGWACPLSIYRSDWLVATDVFVTFFGHAHWLGQWNDITDPIVAGYLCNYLCSNQTFLLNRTVKNSPTSTLNISRRATQTPLHPEKDLQCVWRHHSTNICYQMTIKTLLIGKSNLLTTNGFHS